MTCDFKPTEGKKKFKEGKPSEDYLLTPGEYFLSAWGSIVYQVKSYPLCRIYWEQYDDPDLSNWSRNHTPWGEDGEGAKVYPTPNKNESSWYPVEPNNPDSNWKKSGPNFPSYICEILDEKTREVVSSDVEVTLRWKPLHGMNLDELLQKRKVHQAKTSLRLGLGSLETKVDFELPEEVIQRIRAVA